SATLNIGFPWLVELGMGFDILIGFMIFGLFLLRIHTTHGSLHLKNLEKLKEKL
ncbi:MAG: formate hydrogenlyase, partial [Gammaproteobacteria bacterium CG_4_9_14_3_um_filter_38_9]